MELFPIVIGGEVAFFERIPYKPNPFTRLERTYGEFLRRVWHDGITRW